MTKETPDWPKKKDLSKPLSDDNYARGFGYNESRELCIKSFEEWMKGRELDGEEINKFLKKIMKTGLSSFERNFIAYKIAEHFIRPKGESDE